MTRFDELKQKKQGLSYIGAKALLSRSADENRFHVVAAEQKHLTGGRYGERDVVELTTREKFDVTDNDSGETYTVNKISTGSIAIRDFFSQDNVKEKLKEGGEIGPLCIRSRPSKQYGDTYFYLEDPDKIEEAPRGDSGREPSRGESNDRREEPARQERDSY